MSDKRKSQPVVSNQSELVWDRWENHARNHSAREAIIHWDVLEGHHRWTYGDLVGAALEVAEDLLRRGVKTGDVCAMIMRHHPQFYPIYMGISAMGAIPAVLAYPNQRLHPEKFLSGLSGIAQKSGLDWVLTERDLELVVKPLMLHDQSSVKGIFFPFEWRRDGATEQPNGEAIREKRGSTDKSMPFLLQHSSGTTGLQKAVVLSHQAVLEHVQRYAEAIRLSENDKIVSWLPLYHDMGLIAAFHLPLIFGIPSIQLDPFQWVSAPSILFQAISEEKATLAWLPNFAYNLMADRVRDDEIETMSLSSMRMFVNCSEVVRFESHDRFLGRFCKYGVKKEALAACYAMAESTFAVTQTKPGAEPFVLEVDRGAFAGGVIQPFRDGKSKKVCVSSGKPILGCSLKIVDEKGKEVPEDRVGKIAIRSVSLFNGYRNDQTKTKQVFHDGWYSSSDLGFCHEGEYFVIGREDDVVIVAGHNIYPEDVEDVVNKVKGIVPGRAVAFGVENQQSGTQDLWVAAETSYETKEEKEALELLIKQAGMAINVSIVTVCLVPPRWLIKSSSGKLSRKANKERLVAQGA